MKRICASTAYSRANPLTVNKKPQIKYIHLILGNQGNRQEKKKIILQDKKIKNKKCIFRMERGNIKILEPLIFQLPTVNFAITFDRSVL